MQNPKRRQLVILRRSPYGSSLARAAVDLSLAMGAFEQDCDLLFLGDGVLQLLDGQSAEAIGSKNLGKMLASLPLYDIESVLVDAAALRSFGLTAADLVLQARLVEPAAMNTLLAGYDHLFSC